MNNKTFRGDGLTFVRCPDPTAANQAQMITLPPPWLTVSMRRLCWYAVFWCSPTWSCVSALRPNHFGSSSLVVCTVAALQTLICCINNPSHRIMSTSNSLETTNLCFYWDAQICWWSVNKVLLTRLPFSLLIPTEVAKVHLLFFHTASSFWLYYG